MPNDSAVLRDKKKPALGLATVLGGSPPGVVTRFGLASPFAKASEDKSEAALQGKTKRAACAALLINSSLPILGYWLSAIKTKPAPRSDHLTLPAAATAILPGDCLPGLMESAEADSATCRC